MPCAPQLTPPANGLKLLVQEPLGLQTMLMTPFDLLPELAPPVPHPATAMTRAVADSRRTRVRDIRDTISDLLHWTERPSWDSRGTTRIRSAPATGTSGPSVGKKAKGYPPALGAGSNQALIDYRERAAAPAKSAKTGILRRDHHTARGAAGFSDNKARRDLDSDGIGLGMLRGRHWCGASKPVRRDRPGRVYQRQQHAYRRLPHFKEWLAHSRECGANMGR